MVFCRECGKKATKNLHIDSFTSTCTKCATTKIPEANENSASVIISDDKKLSEIPFSQFQLWIQLAIRDTIQSELKVTLEKYTKERSSLLIEDQHRDLHQCEREIGKVRREASTVTTSLKALFNTISCIEKNYIKDFALTLIRYRPFVRRPFFNAGPFNTGPNYAGFENEANAH